MPARGFIPKEKSVSGFKCPQDKLTLYLEATVAGDLKLKSMLIYHSKIPRAFKTYAKPTQPVLYKWNNKF